MVWNFLGKGILILTLSLWLDAGFCFAQEDVRDFSQQHSQEEVVVYKKSKRGMASIIAIVYVVCASASLVYLTNYAYKMGFGQKRKMKKYALDLAASRAAIHNEEPILSHPAKAVVQAQPLLDPSIARLAFLKDLQTQGLISELDYERQKARILSHF